METIETKKVILTRKIQLLIDSDDADFVKECRDKIYSWQRICFRAANLIVSHQYVQEQVKDFFYFTDDVKMKLADVKKEELGLLVSSKINTIYRLASNHFKGSIPTNILSNLNNTLLSTFQKEKNDYWSGTRALRNYKRDIPLPFGPEVISKFSVSESGRDFSFKLFQIPFRTYLGKDKDKRVLLEKVRSGATKMRASSFRIEDGKIFLYAAFEMEKYMFPLDQSIIAEASLSLEFPVTVKIGDHQYTIGNKEEFLHRRLAIQAARSRVQRAAKYNSPGKGRKRKMKSVEAYKDMERRYVDQKLHLYSRMLIDLCVKHRAATLLLVNQEQKEEIAKEDQFLLQNWSYYNLKQKIGYKASMAGIAVLEE